MKGLWLKELLLALKCSFVVATVETVVGFESEDWTLLLVLHETHNNLGFCCHLWNYAGLTGFWVTYHTRSDTVWTPRLELRMRVEVA